MKYNTMTYSKLTDVISLCPNYTVGRKGKKIDNITIHCVVGYISLDGAKSLFMNSASKSSANYVITKDGKIVLKVFEEDRAWTTGGTYKKGNKYNGYTLNETGSENDYHSITIEVASGTSNPYKITDESLDALIKLVADIAKRYNMGTLKWKNDPTLIGNTKEQSFTLHRWFSNKACPGDYIISKMDYIVNEANKINGTEDPNVEFEYYPIPTNYKGTSIVMALKSIGADYSYNARGQIALKNGIPLTLYKGTAEQNLYLLNLLYEGKLRK